VSADDNDAAGENQPSSFAQEQRAKAALRLEQTARDTGNALYLWQVVNHCGMFGLPIPEYTAKYLRAVAENIVGLMMDTEPPVAMERIPAALMLRDKSNAHNAFKKFVTDEESRLAAILSEHNEAVGLDRLEGLPYPAKLAATFHEGVPLRERKARYYRDRIRAGMKLLRRNELHES
jgi:hypothetical protein